MVLAAIAIVEVDLVLIALTVNQETVVPKTSGLTRLIAIVRNLLDYPSSTVNCLSNNDNDSVDTEG